MRAALLLVALLALPLDALASEDPLDVPARHSEIAVRSPINALCRAGAALLVAVGQRGHILRSADAGRSWRQAAVPVSSDLTAVQFVDGRTGFAVGHEGVVLRSDDGGASWRKLLDGRRGHGVPDKPLLDLWFSSADEGFVVGAHNLIFKTSDGGLTWQSWSDRTDNPKRLHLYAIRPAGRRLLVAGEGGLLLELDASTQRFRSIASPYAGSFFGLVGSPLGIVLYGMRGHAYFSADEGRSWRPVATGLDAGIIGGDALPDGRVALADQAGHVASSADGGRSFQALPLRVDMPLSSIAFADGALVIGGLRGVRPLQASGSPR
jgi:photosystem II stability/assembly factor-like uncharacterized protein